MNLIFVSIAIFGAAALFGLTVLIHWLVKKEAPKVVIYSHGTLGAVSLVLLVAYTALHPENFPKVSLLLFCLVAVVGFYMFFMNQVRRTRPVAVAVVHGLVAVTAFVLLILFAI